MTVIIMADKMDLTTRLSTQESPQESCADRLADMYDTFYDRIYAYCVHRIFCRSAAEDVASQVFLSAAEKIHSFRGESSEAHANWLFAIAVNQCHSYIRKHLRRKKLFETFQYSRMEQLNADSMPAASVPADWGAIYNAMGQLKELEQTVITLRYFEQMPHEQIAAVVNKGQSTVRVVLHRGLKKLQKMLKRPEGDSI
jgi:RNA polymerase sigma-70 factor (ECF subfamily)